MNPSRIEGREQGREACEDSPRTRRHTKDPEFDRALAAVNCGPQDSAPVPVPAGKATGGTASGSPNMGAHAEAVSQPPGQSTGVIQIPELSPHPHQEKRNKQDRPTPQTRFDAASAASRDTGDRSPEQGDAAGTDRQPQELPVQLRRLWADARSPSAGGEPPTSDAEAGGAKGEPTTSQSWVHAAWDQGVTGRRVDAGGSTGSPQRGSAATPEQPDNQTAAGSGRSQQVTVHFTGEGGLDGRLRVAVRGQSVQATIVAEDHLMAERLGRRIDELHHALRERGFSETNVSIQRAQHEAPQNRMPYEAGSHREEEGRENGEMQRDRSRSDPEGKRSGHGKEHHDSERQVYDG